MYAACWADKVFAIGDVFVTDNPQAVENDVVPALAVGGLTGAGAVATIGWDGGATTFVGDCSIFGATGVATTGATTGTGFAASGVSAVASGLNT